MFDQTHNQIIILTRASYRHTSIIWKDDWHSRCRFFSTAIRRQGWPADIICGIAAAVGGGIIIFKACLVKELLDLANSTSAGIAAINDDCVIDSDLFGENFMTWLDARIFRQDIFQVTVVCQ